MTAHTLGPGQFIEFILTGGKVMWTVEIQILYEDMIVVIAIYAIANKPENFFGFIYNCNYHCDDHICISAIHIIFNRVQSVTFQFYFSEGPGFSLLERLPTLGTTGFFIQPAAEKNILKHLCEPYKRFREQNVLMAGGTRQYMCCLQRATDWPCSLF